MIMPNHIDTAVMMPVGHDGGSIGEYLDAVTEFPASAEVTSFSERIAQTLGGAAVAEEIDYVPNPNETLPTITAPDADAEVAQLLMHSLKMRNPEAFEKSYAQLSKAEQAAFDRFEAREYMRMEQSVGKNALEALDIAKPKNIWVSMPPYELLAQKAKASDEEDPDTKRTSSKRKKRPTLVG